MWQFLFQNRCLFNMPPKNKGPCRIPGCDAPQESRFRVFTTDTKEKAIRLGTYDQCCHLTVGQDSMCHAHYMCIAENSTIRRALAQSERLRKGQTEEEPVVWNMHGMYIMLCNSYTYVFKQFINKAITVRYTKLSFQECMVKVTKVLREKQRVEGVGLVFDPDEFRKMIETSDPDLEGFFDAMVHAMVNQDRSAYNKQEAKKNSGYNVLLPCWSTQ
jgi:hypothetical protein